MFVMVFVLTNVDAYFYQAETFPRCFGIECHNNGELNVETCTCQCPPNYTGHECEYHIVESVWPDDNFALPETVFGCPEEDVISWRKISVHLKAKNISVSSDPLTERQSWPAIPHYRGPLHDHNVTLHFCMKRKTSDESVQWPYGQYCVYRKHPCPSGMVPDFLILNGYQVFTSNVAMETIEFMYEEYQDDVTSVYLSLCCMDQRTDLTMLPYLKPFMLIQLSGITSCQPVNGTEVHEEWFGFTGLVKMVDNVTDYENFNGTSNSNNQTRTEDIASFEISILNVSYCFYKPYERTECLYDTDGGSSYRGRLNLARYGLKCIPWRNVSGIEYSSVLEEDYCRITTKQRLGCYVIIQQKHRRINCDIEYCRDKNGNMDSLHSKYRNIAFYRQITSNTKKQGNLKNVVNGLSWRGSLDGREFKAPVASNPWITIHLGSQFLIHGVTLYRKEENCEYPYKWTNIAIWIHTFEHQFESYGGHLCWEIEDFLNICNIEIRCVQPLPGYFVTIQASINALGENMHQSTTEVNFEEIEVYGEVTTCGQLFNIGEGDLTDYQWYISNGTSPQRFNFRERQGCFQSEVNITLDLLAPMIIEGIAVAIETSHYINVHIQTQNVLLNISNRDQYLEMFKTSEDIQLKYFDKEVFTRFVRIQFTTNDNYTSESEACIGFDLIGCPKIVSRDPLCTKKESSVGISIESNTKIFVNSEATNITQIKETINHTACMKSCLEDDNCVTWGHTDDICVLIPTSIFRGYHVDDDVYNVITKKTVMYDDSSWSGEKICPEDIRYKYPCLFELELDVEPLYVSSRNYPGPYLHDVHCTWVISHKSYVQSAVKVTFLDLDFMEPRNLIKKTNLYDACTDLLSIGNTERSTSNGPHLVLAYENATTFNGATTYVELSENIYINFITCKRMRNYHCSGCKNKFTTCTDVSLTSPENITECLTLNCGYISSMNFMGLDGHVKVCRWYIKTRSMIQVDFMHFDIAGDETCSTGSLTLYGESIYMEDGEERTNFDTTSGWYLISKLCNANRPLSVMYIATDLGVEYMPNSGDGFLLKWTHILPDGMNRSISLETVPNGGSEYCDEVSLSKNYQVFIDYPYKCYIWEAKYVQRDEDSVDWFYAADVCQQFRGKLVEVADSVEEEIIFQILKENKLGSAYMGFKRNHTTGFIHDSDNNHITYINWGFDRAKSSMEPNGLEQDTCIMLRDVLQPTGSTMRSKWADVNCYDKHQVLVICEKQLVAPYIDSEENRTIDFNLSITNRSESTMYTDRMFECNNGEYILSVLHCDKVTDCHDNSDEIDCVYSPCDDDSWKCNNEQCIPLNNRLDQKYDCIDHSDEIIQGTQWRFDFETSNVIDGGTLSNVFIKIYSYSGISGELFFDRHDIEFTAGVTISVHKIVNISEPFKIRVRVDKSGFRPWYLKMITLINEDTNKVYIFQCDCTIPDLSTQWITYTDISVYNSVTLVPQLESTVYTITVVTGVYDDAGTDNNIYIVLYGENSDSGIFQLLHKYSVTSKTSFERVNTFTYETPSLGNISMVEVFYFGEYIYDEWFLEELIIHDSVYDQNITFKYNNWLRVNIKDSNISVTLYPENTSLHRPSYIQGNYSLAKKKNHCPDNMYKCIDGHCIPQSYYCDQIVHCHGPFHEDEPLICSYKHIGQSCTHTLSYPGNRDSYYDIIFQDGVKPYKVHCLHDDINNQVITRIHHNYEYWILVIDDEDFHILYSINTEGINQLKLQSEVCRQVITVECFHVTDDFIYDSIVVVLNDGIEYNMFKSVVNKSCISDTSCKCQKTSIEWYSNRLVEFYSDNVVVENMHQLPIVSIGVKKMYSSLSQLKLNIGTLDCYQDPIQYSNTTVPCQNGRIYDTKYKCILEYDDYNKPHGCNDLSHLTNCDLFQCDAGYTKCKSGYCIPLHYICNGKNDCIHGEDELNCDSMECTGSLRCRQSGLCVDFRHVCDGNIDCPHGDDELACDSTFIKIRSLSVNTSTNLQNYTYLTRLYLSGGDLREIDLSTFSGLFNLLTLDLSNNFLAELNSNVFADLIRLEKLYLSGNNELRVIHPGAFHGLIGVADTLDLSNMKISTIFSGTFEGLQSLKILNLSYNEISELEDYGFGGMDQLEELYINGNPVTIFSSGVFDGLTSLQTLVSDLYLLCCVRPPSVPDHQCYPTRDEFSSCDDLMRNEVLRYSVWIIGFFALFGNSFALIYRIIAESTGFRTANGVFLTNLCIADFLMGVYMMIIAGADLHFRGEYVWNDIAWRQGTLCRLAGFLSFLSSEASGMFLCMITIDRWLTIRYTLKRVGFNRNTALLTCLSLWCVCIILAILPLLKLGYFADDFYTKSGVCLALPLTRDRRGGWEYAVSIFVFLNFAMFVFIAVGQFLILSEIRAAKIIMDGTQKRDDVAIARKLLLIVMSNFLCWFPICIMGLMAMVGFVIDSEVYSWVAVFVLPLNSATNPVLYTLSSIFTGQCGQMVKQKLTLRKEKTHPSEEEEAKNLDKLFESGLIRLNYEPDIISLSKYMELHKLTLAQNVRVTKVLATALDLLHTLGYVAGPFSTDEVLLRLHRTKGIVHISLMSIPLYSDTIDDVSSDIANLGLVLKKMVEPRKRLSKRSTRKKVPGFPDTHILLGDLWIKTFDEYFERSVNLVQTTGVKIHKIWIYFFYPVYSINHPDTAKIILTKSIPKNNNKGSGYTILKPWIGDGILANVGDNKWERNRRLLTPAFHFDILKSYVEKFNDVADELLIHLSQCRDTSIEICQPISVSTLDALLQCAFSYDGNIQELGMDHPYVSSIHQLCVLCLQRMSNPILYLDFIYKRTQMGQRFYKLCDYVHEFSEDIIKSRQDELLKNEDFTEKRHKDFLDIVLMAHDEDGNGLTQDEIRAEVDTFLFAGHDTTSASISWGIYALGKYPDIQDLVYTEVISIVGDGEETMRMYSIVPLIGRGLREPLTIDGVTLPAGTSVEINIHAINHRSDVWSDHEEFRPERFETSTDRDPFSYIPFSAGNRNCIGQNFAMMEQKVFLCRLVQMFHVELDPKHMVVAEPQLVMRAKHGIKVFLKPR
ncbi:hypothetical protein ACF0H5_007082 [Mactra antiquata]